MKKKILNLSIVLALFAAIVIAVSMPVYATSTDTTTEETVCNHTTTRTEITKKASMSISGQIDTKCTACGAVVGTEAIPGVGATTTSCTSTYTGYTLYPTVSLIDTTGKTISPSNYTVSYKKNGKTVSTVRDAGTYTVVFTLKNNYTGTINRNFTVKPIDTKNRIIIPNAVYTGKATTPKVYCNGRVLKKGTDYTISKISNNKKFGTASVTLKFKGNYSGTVKTKYTISTAKVSGIKLKKRDTSSFTISWKKVKNATGYKIYRYDHKKNKYTLYKTTSSTSAKITRSSKDASYIDMYIVAYKKVGKKSYNSEQVSYYNCVKPSKIKYSTSSPSKGKVKISFSGLSKIYSKNVEIQISTNKSFNSKKAKVQKYNTYVYNYSDKYYNAKIYEATNLKSKKTYYVRCREVSYDYNGKTPKKIYGSWGTVKTIKTK